jgi:hypothetical protein
MNIRNKKGIFGIDDVIIASIVAMIFVGPALVKSVGSAWNGGDKNQAKMTHKVKEYKTPFYQDAKGNFVPAPKQDIKEEEISNYNSTPAKTNLWDTLKPWLGLIVLGCLFIPGFGAWLITQLFKARANIVQMVNGFENAKKQLPASSVAILETNLSKKMDQKSKDTVRNVKAKLIKTKAIDSLATPVPAVITAATPTT